MMTASLVVPTRAGRWGGRQGGKRNADEDGKRKRLASGELGLDMYGMREPLQKAGLVYVDKPEDV